MVAVILHVSNLSGSKCDQQLLQPDYCSGYGSGDDAVVTMLVLPRHSMLHSSNICHRDVYTAVQTWLASPWGEGLLVQ